MENIKASLANRSQISLGCEVEGDIKCKGDFRIDGKLKGNIYTEGKLVLGEKGVIQGEIKSIRLEVLGKIKGHVDVRDMLIIKSGAEVIANVVVEKLLVEENAFFSGKCIMKKRVYEQESEKK